MPFYSNEKVFEKCDQTYFGKKLLPGSAINRTGIYRCESCGFETIRRAYETLPQEHLCEWHNRGLWSAEGKSVGFWRLVALVLDRDSQPSLSLRPNG
jgi:hypothetical protein